MNREPRTHDTEDRDKTRATHDTAIDSSEEPVGAEISMTEDGTTFEPEEDPQGPAE